MGSVFALPIVYEDVKQLLFDDGTGINVVFGWREAAKQINQGAGRAARVVFIPGVGGRAGSYASAKFPGRHSRALATLLETAEVRCWGGDGSDPNNELLQYEAARDVHDQVVRAIYLSRVGHGAFAISEPRWIVDKIERRWGAELAFTLEVQAKIPDEPGARVPGNEAAVKPESAEGPTEMAVTGGSASLLETDITTGGS